MILRSRSASTALPVCKADCILPSASGYVKAKAWSRLNSVAQPLPSAGRQRHTCILNRPSGRRQAQQLRTQAAAEDPYQVLGLSSKADSEAVSRSYKLKLREAAGDDAQKQRIESAHSSIMMASLTSRLQGGGQSIAKEVKYADKAQYFPWRPRRYPAGRNFTLIVGAIQAFLLAWSLLSPLTAGTQPLVTSAAVGAGSNLLKQNQIFPPPPSSAEEPGKRGRGMKNVIRGLILAMAATFLGCAIFVTLPDTVASSFNRTMPYWFYEKQNQLLCVGTVVSNFVMTAFFR